MNKSLTIIFFFLILKPFLSISLSITPRKMFAAFGQFASSSQFYLFGRSRCTRTGWEKASKAYSKPDIMKDGRDSRIDLSDKVYMITGANAGIGQELTSFLARNNATVYMVCRSAERGQAARDAIVAESRNDKVHLLLGDCGLEKDVRRLWTEFTAHQEATTGKAQLDAMVCNAGALLNELTFTEEEVEVTFATHLLFGTYLLGSLAMPTLQATPNARFIALSSGGMYNSKFPAWDIATNTGNAKYDGQFAYVYAKRGQVLLCEQWAQTYRDSVKIVSCHPGWVDTPGVEKAYGASKSYLEPLRSLWEGTEGIAWLCVGPAEQMESGAFYLDRSPQVKHLSGPFFTEGSFTKNSPEEVQEMMRHLQLWSFRDTRPSKQQVLARAAAQLPLVAAADPIDLNAFMGNWYVLANIPSSFEIGATNCIEMYELDPTRPNTVKVNFDYSFAQTNGGFSTSHMKMRGNVKNTTTNTFWAMDPKIVGVTIPFGLSYLILYTAPDYSYTLVSVPDRTYMWIMVREPPSEFPPANVKIIDAYPELHTETFATVKTECKLSHEVVKEEAVPTPTKETFDAVQQGKRAREVEILRKTLTRAEELGFDVNKVLRCPWYTQLEKETFEKYPGKGPSGVHAGAGTGTGGTAGVCAESASDGSAVGVSVAKAEIEGVKGVLCKAEAEPEVEVNVEGQKNNVEKNTTHAEEAVGTNTQGEMMAQAAEANDAVETQTAQEGLKEVQIKEVEGAAAQPEGTK